MKTKDLIKKHKTCIEILEAIEVFESLIEHKALSIEALNGNFPDLKAKYLHNIDIYKRCINRLNLRYTKQ